MGVVRGANAQLKPAGVAKRFGVRRYKSQTSSKMVRLEEAVGKRFYPSVGNTEGLSDFDEEPIFRDIRLCNLVNGVVTAYEGEPGFTRTPSEGDVMVEIPRYYYQITDNTEYTDLMISNKSIPGYKLSPRHISPSNPDGFSKIYVSAYPLNASNRSMSGQTIKGSITRAAARTLCANRGGNYWQFDFACYYTINMLYMVEVADLNSQSAIGAGYTTGSVLQKTGLADTVAWHSGRANTSGTETLNTVKYRHIENLWGNAWIFVDGVNFNGAKTYVCVDPNKYADNTSDNYTQLSYDKAAGPGYISDMGIDSAMSWPMLPKAVTGDALTYFGDTYYPSAPTWQILFVGGKYDTGTISGLFAMHTDYGSTYSVAYAGCRLMCLSDE